MLSKIQVAINAKIIQVQVSMGGTSLKKLETRVNSFYAQVQSSQIRLYISWSNTENPRYVADSCDHDPKQPAVTISDIG